MRVSNPLGVPLVYEEIILLGFTFVQEEITIDLNSKVIKFQFDEIENWHQKDHYSLQV